VDYSIGNSQHLITFADQEAAENFKARFAGLDTPLAPPSRVTSARSSFLDSYNSWRALPAGLLVGKITKIEGQWNWGA
jgi:hypothetical protein